MFQKKKIQGKEERSFGYEKRRERGAYYSRPIVQQAPL